MNDAWDSSTISWKIIELATKLIFLAKHKVVPTEEKVAWGHKQVMPSLQRSETSFHYLSHSK